MSLDMSYKYGQEYIRPYESQFQPDGKFNPIVLCSHREKVTKIMMKKYEKRLQALELNKILLRVKEPFKNFSNTLKNLKAIKKTNLDII